MEDGSATDHAQHALVLVVKFCFMHPKGITITPSFQAAVEAYDLDALGADPATVFGVDTFFRITLYNSAYARFATSNGGGEDFLARWGLGASLLDAIPTVLLPFYIKHLRAAVATDEVWHHSYECGSPDRDRTLQLTAYPTHGRGLLFVHSLRLDTPRTPELVVAQLESYRDEHGLLNQCSHCRRVRDPGGRWDFVRAAVETVQPNVSHGLCAVCAAHYYGDFAQG